MRPNKPFRPYSFTQRIVLTQPQHFVRLYSPESGSSPNGAWLMRSEYVRGLTKKQLKDRFALPIAPTTIVNVDLPASPDPATGKDYALWTGIAGPIEGFGEEGAVQNRIIADFNGTHYFPNYEFVVGIRDHSEAIGDFALSYKPMAGKGNTQHTAAYLDQFVPKAYSDLENVYTALDFLNWVDFGPKPIRHALNQIGPQDYNAVTFVVTRNALLFGDAVLERCRFLRTCKNRCSMDSNSDFCNPICETSSCESNGNNVAFNFQGIGEYMNERGEQHQAGYDVGVHVQGGCDLPMYCWQISPLVRLSYFYVHENGFAEKGAESLDLKVRGFDAQTLRTDLGIGVARAFNLFCAKITPRIYVGWVRNFFLDNRIIESNLKHLGSSFKVHGFNRDKNGFLGAASLMVRHPNGLGMEGSYDAEIDEGFISHKIKLCVNWCF